MAYVLFGIFMSVTVGLFVAAIVTSSMKGIKQIITMILISGLIGAGLAFLLSTEHKAEDKAWNNGICTECSGNMELISVTATKSNNKTYYYKCNDCNHVITLKHLYN